MLVADVVAALVVVVAVVVVACVIAYAQLLLLNRYHCCPMPDVTLTRLDQSAS